MATNSFEYQSCSRICCGDLPAPIILCIPADIVAPHLCPSTYGYSGSGDAGPAMPFDFGFIEAEIGSETEVKGPCSTVAWRYIFSYDTDQLVAAAVLSQDSVQGLICQNCFTQWVEQYVGNEVYIETADSGALTLISQHGCEYPISGGAISDAPFNCITREDDGLYVQCSESTATNGLVNANGTTQGASAELEYTINAVDTPDASNIAVHLPDGAGVAPLLPIYVINANGLALDIEVYVAPGGFDSIIYPGAAASRPITLVASQSAMFFPIQQVPGATVWGAIVSAV